MFRQYGHEPGLMAAKFVSPSRMAGKSGKSDAADAQSICAGEHKKPVAIIECSYHNKAQWPPPQMAPLVAMEHHSIWFTTRFPGHLQRFYSQSAVR